MLPDLDQLLEYKNPAVLKLYEQNYPGNALSAAQAFTEVLKYLWLAKKHALDLPTNLHNENFPSQCFMPRSMREIDEMWHEFILFTEDYTNFCLRYFGEYLHHLPNIFDNRPSPRDVVEREIEKLLPYIYDNLGEDTVRTWFCSYLDNADDRLVK
jgi:hypothetical protein